MSDKPKDVELQLVDVINEEEHSSAPPQILSPEGIPIRQPVGGDWTNRSTFGFQEVHYLYNSTMERLEELEGDLEKTALTLCGNLETAGFVYLHLLKKVDQALADPFFGEDPNIPGYLKDKDELHKWRGNIENVLRATIQANKREAYATVARSNQSKTL